MPTRYYCERCRKIAKRGPTCVSCDSMMMRHDMKTTRFRILAYLFWILAVFFVLWPLFAPLELIHFSYLAFLLAGIAVALQWFDARFVAMAVLRAHQESKSPGKEAR